VIHRSSFFKELSHLTEFIVSPIRELLAGLGAKLGEVPLQDTREIRSRCVVVQVGTAGRLGDDLVDDESDEVVDVVLLWWREGDGDLADALIGAGTPLTDRLTVCADPLVVAVLTVAVPLPI